ncbi:3-isopropylmalate dehydratase large subunit, partial [Candidatus Bathyarchaeota archaeon]|nr:3-isopropylmalate dehydratase large subunit [Candidatus Bathyarchaeota archaeon]
MNIIEKILAKASNRRDLNPGEIIEAKIDKVMANDITAPLAVKAFEDMGGKKVWNKEKIILVLDHLVPANRDRSAELHMLLRRFAREQKIKHFYDVGRGGVCHQIMMENHVKPGEVIVGGDSHTCTYGAIGAFATGIGSTEVASVFLTGKLWFKVPKAINIVVEGKLKPPIAPKDLILYTIGQFRADGATYMGVKFSGEAIRDISIDGKMTLCNMVVEMGAKNGIIEPDEKTALYLKERRLTPFDFIKDDIDATYYKTLYYDASELEPMVACPFTVDNVKPVSEVDNVEIDQAVIGSCTNGRLEDLRIAAQIFHNKKVTEGVRVLIIPSSRKVYMDA